MNLYIEVMHGYWRGTEGQTSGPTRSIEKLVDSFFDGIRTKVPEVVVDSHAIQVQQIVHIGQTPFFLGLS